MDIGVPGNHKEVNLEAGGADFEKLSAELGKGGTDLEALNFFHWKDFDFEDVHEENPLLETPEPVENFQSEIKLNLDKELKSTSVFNSRASEQIANLQQDRKQMQSNAIAGYTIGPQPVISQPTTSYQPSTASVSRIYFEVHWFSF